MAAVALFQQPSSDPITVRDLILAYCTSLDRRLRTKDVTADHVANCKRDLANFQAFVGPDKLVMNCHQFDLTEWLRANPNWKSQHTRQRAVNAVIGCFRWGADDEEGQMIDRNPYRLPKILKATPPQPRRPAEEAEYRALFRASPVLRPALFFLWHTGARTCEMREMTWGDVFLGEFPHVRLDEHKTSRKTGKPRIIALNPVAAKFLAWLKARSKSKWVFVNADGGKWSRNSWCKRFRMTCIRAGLHGKKLSAYCIRHTWACEAIEGGDTFERVADQLGNSAEVVRRIYASHTRQHLEYMSEAATAMAKARKRK